jgi:hypothetical protein
MLGELAQRVARRRALCPTEEGHGGVLVDVSGCVSLEACCLCVVLQAKGEW